MKLCENHVKIHVKYCEVSLVERLIFLLTDCVESSKLLPVEVKSGGNVDSISLRKYKEAFGDKVKSRVRFSMLNLKLDNDLLNLPMFLADQADRLIGLMMDK